jgi:low temperature requirement protein LtrA
MSKKTWWQPPRRFEDKQNERKISWLELFYDLVYVACIGEITSHIAAHPDGKDIGYAVLFFVFVYWSWINGTQYYELHGNDTVRTRWFVFLQMLAVGAVAISAPAAFRGNGFSFTVSFLVIQGIIIYLLASVSFYDKSHIKLSGPFLLCYATAFAILFASLFCPPQAILPLYLLAIIINMFAPVLSARYFNRTLASRGEQFSASLALVERFGQFTIIVLAEGILSIVSGFSLVNTRSLLVWCIFCLSISIAFLLWSLYFDMTNEQELKTGYRYYQLFVFVHLVLLGALGVFGACLKNLVGHLETPVPLVLNRIILISLAIFLAAMCIIGRLIADDHRQTRNYLRQVIRSNMVVVLLLVAVSILSKGWSVFSLLLTVFLLLAIPVVVGIVTWLKHEIHSENQRD